MQTACTVVATPVNPSIAAFLLPMARAASQRVNHNSWLVLSRSIMRFPPHSFWVLRRILCILLQCPVCFHVALAFRFIFIHRVFIVASKFSQYPVPDGIVDRAVHRLYCLTTCEGDSGVLDVMPWLPPVGMGFPVELLEKYAEKKCRSGNGIAQSWIVDHTTTSVMPGIIGNTGQYSRHDHVAVVRRELLTNEPRSFVIRHDSDINKSSCFQRSFSFSHSS